MTAAKKKKPRRAPARHARGSFGPGPVGRLIEAAWPFILAGGPGSRRLHMATIEAVTLLADLEGGAS